MRLVATGTEFSGNAARATGGALNALMDSWLTIGNCTLANNTAQLSGGAQGFWRPQILEITLACVAAGGSSMSVLSALCLSCRICLRGGRVRRRARGGPFCQRKLCRGQRSRRVWGHGRAERRGRERCEQLRRI